MRHGDVYHLHRLYRSPILWLALQLTRDNRTFHSVLAGQLAQRWDPLGKPLASVEVALVRGDHVVARATSDPKGEFTLEYDSGEIISLCVLPDQGEPIRVPVI